MSTQTEVLHCRKEGYQTPHQVKKASHLLHLILSIITGGLWVPIWLLAILFVQSPTCLSCGAINLRLADYGIIGIQLVVTGAALWFWLHFAMLGCDMAENKRGQLSLSVASNADATDNKSGQLNLSVANKTDAVAVAEIQSAFEAQCPAIFLDGGWMDVIKAKGSTHEAFGFQSDRGWKHQVVIDLSFSETPKYLSRDISGHTCRYMIDRALSEITVGKDVCMVLCGIESTGDGSNGFAPLVSR